MAEQDLLDVRDEVMGHLEKIERNLNWLAGKTGYKYDTLYSIFKKKSFELSDNRLKGINKALGTKFKK